MKPIGLFCLLLLSAAWMQAQAPVDSLPPAYEKKDLRETEISLLYSYYDQDGQHSAVTGGEGTEDLQVQAPAIVYVYRWDSLHRFSVNAGVDIITSASTDKIDFRVSSASRHDGRTHLEAGYDRLLPKRDLNLGLSGSFSVESDYLSGGLGLSMLKNWRPKNASLGVDLHAFFDNLEWGWLNPDYFHGHELVYPQELRSVEWFDEVNRYSYSLSLAYQQVINRRMQAALLADVVFQEGLLSTPFHRVYFSDLGPPKVENLPRSRWKLPLGLQLNVFATDFLILRSYYRFYWDDFGIRAHTISLEAPFKGVPLWSVSPFVRFYTQTASDYFAPKGEHLSSQEFYTSDYDLSSFHSFKTGLGLRYAPFVRLGHTDVRLHSLSLRYAHYRRSDGLVANLLSFALTLKK